MAEKRPVKFGWCIDGNHRACPGAVPSGTCPCDCHKKESA